ncbi:SCP2 sterol-binding domain-containing protein [Actinoplanes sp. Pm04-4]|uniref:SCP2 sterol-binding domain-containing protein n=1 Tax=Paractinoplanes pyxinae TaxID=2997416 RepID=A0ABT4ASR5_9ACTN|nr:SCP2 sterol-binding domain-containing protein [Actinoplanes pyxinae]MCY1137286.1 SCP2 sterol-binding domain-containing protein [Actinoplanes pyxinae]
MASSTASPVAYGPDTVFTRLAVIHWTITGGPNGSSDTYETVIESGLCTVTSKPVRKPLLIMTMDPVSLLKLISGVGRPMMMFMTGKIRAKGDLGLAADMSKLFNVPI